MKTAAIIVAGGSGTRVGGTTPKQFLPLLGKPLLLHTLERFQKSKVIDSITLVLPAEWLNDFQTNILKDIKFSKLKKLVAGGKTRQDSTRLGFLSLESQTELVLVHDGARPLVSFLTIERCVEVAKEQGAAIAAFAASDTVKEVDANQQIQNTPDRRKLYLAQTPQVVRYDWLKLALEKADKENFQGTDEASLVEYLGYPVKVVESPKNNIKVTHPEDFELAEFLMKSQRGEIE